MFRWLTGLRVVLRSAIFRNRAERELEEEFQYHLEEEINDRLKAGLDPKEARYAAMRVMGAISKSKEECRDARGTRWVEALFCDFRYGVRSIKRSKGLALGIVVSMGLGIGATASVFSFVDAALFRLSAVPETNRVVRITNSTPTTRFGNFSYPEYQDYLERAQSFIGIVTYQYVTEGLAAKPGDEPRVTGATLVSGNFFSTLEVKPVLGRGLLPDDSFPGKDAVAVISYREWQRDFGGRADVIGRVVHINSHPITIVGVAPEEFRGVDRVIEPEIYIPHTTVQQAYMGLDTTSLTNRSARFARLLARLKPGVIIEQANEDVGRIASQLEQEHPDTNKGTRAVVWTQFGFRQASGLNFAPGMLLLGVAFLVLGIACVNVSNLLLSATPARTGEMAVRAAMGASRMRMVQQLLLESTILLGAGTLVGLAIASWCAHFLDSIQLGPDLPLHLQTRVDERVVLSTLGIALLSALLAGAIPAWRCTRNNLNSLLKSSDPRNHPHKIRTRQMLAALQVAATSLLLIVSGLFLKDLRLAGAQNPGFRVEHLWTMNLDPTLDPRIGGNNRERVLEFYRELVARVRSMPGVRSAAIAQDKPFGLVNNGSTGLIIEGYQLPLNQQSIETRSAFVGDRYFDTLDIPIIRGRAFDRRDGVNARRTVIVNETMAQRYWPNRDPIGTHVEIMGDGGGAAEVIGIARNSKYAGMDERPMPFLYRSYDQGNETGAALLVETDGNPETFTASVRRVARDIAPDVGIFGVRTMQAHFNEVGLLEVRLSAGVFTTVSGIGLVLGVLGLYAVIAYSVGQRTHEIGIRMAVGASGRQVLRMVLLQGLGSSSIAATIGVCLALALSGTIADFVSYVNPRDPVVYMAVLFLMLFVTGAACYIPARRASMVDPNLTLRNQ